MDNGLAAHAPNWDPKPDERIYYRSATTGDLGWIVRRDGIDKIRLDRANQEIIRAFDEAAWIPDRDYKPFTLFQISHLAFEADKVLCRMVGLQKESKREFNMLPDKDRIEWMTNGPDTGGLRAELYEAIMGVLKEHAR